MVDVWCLVYGKPAKDAFYVEVDRSVTVGRLKEAIKEKESSFKNIDAHKLEVWCNNLDKPQPKVTLEPRTPLHSIYPNGQGQGDYIIVQSTSVDTPVSSTPLPGYLETPTALKRKHEHELEDLQKLQRVSDWVEYDAKDGSIDLPPVLISMLDNGEFTPAPRNEFKQLLGDMKVGQEITLPSIGQQPKHYGEGYQELSFLITEQMLEMWHLLSSDSSRPIRRVLSGPMGVGKSYLALFLAAKAYAEGWLLLYVSDANVLALEDTAMIAAEICKRFLDLNKDILTVDDLRKMTFGHLTGDGALIRAATVILHTLLQQRRTKTLLVIDEHGALFEQNPPVPIKHALLNPLMKLGAWKETSAGTRVVLTGTAHARFEMEYVKSDMSDWLEYVGPLSDTVFDKLLDMNPILSGTMIREQVKETTNRVPRELIKMAESVSAECGIPGRHIDENMDQVIPSLINQFNKKRRDTFFREASTYFNRLKDLQRHPYRCALSAMFLPRKEDDFDCEEKGFDYEFLDLGLVYRTKVGSRTKYSFLSPAAKDALLDLYKSMPLPHHTMAAITSGAPTGDQFEDALFTFLAKHSEVILDATNLVGTSEVPVVIRAGSVKVLENSPSRVSDDVLVRCYKGYPRFDYIYGRTFIQVSVSDFATHNVESADITKAFLPDEKTTRSNGGRNQIEKYLDAAFGGQHQAQIDPTTKQFVVTKQEVNGAGVQVCQKVEDFRILYIRGKPGRPNHTGKVKEFPDVLHVSFEELRKKVFGDLVAGTE